MAALLVSEPRAAFDGTQHEIYSSLANAGQPESSTAPRPNRLLIQPTAAHVQSEASNSKLVREKQSATAEPAVLGRAPSRATSEAEAAKPNRHRVGLKLGGGIAIRPNRPVDVEDENNDTAASQGDDEAEDDAQTKDEESYSPSKDRAIHTRWWR